MSIVKQSLVGASGQGGGSTINDSLRFRSSATAYLSRTPATAGNRKTWTWSAWVKRGVLGTYQTLFGAGSSSAVSPYETLLRFNDTNTLSLIINGAGGIGGFATTTALFRDSSAWYHVVAYVDMSASGQANKARIYINGVLQSVTYGNFSSTDDTQVNNTVIHRVGANSYSSANYVDGYLTEVNFIDGQALDPTDFGEFDDNGTWKPLEYEGTYGTNGFYLNGVGVTDESGNGNDWTNNNLNLSTSTATTYDQMKDTPSLVDENAGNFCTLNPLNKGTAASSSNANLTYSCGANSAITGSIGITSGKWYWEIETPTARCLLGIINSSATLNTYIGVNANGWGYYGINGNKYNSGATAYGATFTTTDVIAVAFDADAGTLTFYKNNTSQGTAFTGLTSGPYFPAVSDDTLAGATGNFNFGQRPFAYTPPTGFKKLNTFNLPDSTIENGSDYFNTVLYTGTGAARSITVGFQPDFVWAKMRSSAETHRLADSVRGAGKVLYSNLTNAEATEATGITSFNSDGFSLGAGTPNASGQTYVAWNWLASNTTATNSAGTNGATIASTYSANTTSGFSISTHEAQAGTYSFYHGLGVAPSMFVFKNMDAASNWTWWQNDIASAPTNKIIYLNLTNAVGSSGSNWLQSVTSNVIQLTAGQVHGTSGTYLTYAFAEVPGYSAFGKYTGNGLADGPFVYTGFRPRYLMIKRTDVADAWAIKDTARDTYNVDDSVLKANESTAESTSIYWNIDILSNGFKLRNLGSTFNNNGGNYIYMAFAENPFKNVNAR